MTSLTSRAPKDFYRDLLQVSNSNMGVDSTLRTVEDGEGTSSALQISESVVNVNGVLRVSGAEWKIGAGGNIQPYDVSYVKTGIANLFTKQQNTSLATLTDGATIAWNLDDAQNARLTLAGSRTLANPTNMVAGGTYLLFVTQDATGSRTLTYGTAYKWSGGVVPALSLNPGAVDILAFTSDGSAMFGGLVGQNFS